MRKHFAPLLVLALVAFPQLTMAHFESSHTPFWNEPMHWLIQHHTAITLIAVGLVGGLVYLKKSSEKGQ